MDIKMINLGVYYEHLKKKIEELSIERSKEKDPYKQWVIDEKRKMVTDLLQDYKELMINQ